MDIKLLKANIASNTIPKFMIFSGEEQGLCKHYIQKISSTINKYYKYYDSADAALVEIASNMREDFLYIILNDDAIIKKPSAYIDALVATGRNIIVYNTTYDSKASLYKDYKDYCLIFNKIDKYSIVGYLMKLLQNAGIELTQDRVEKLVDACDCNLGYCLNELDKIIVLDQKTSNVVFDFMLEHNFPDYRKVNVFSSIQKLLNKDKSFLDDLTKINESTIGLLTLICRQAKNKLGVSNAVELADLMELCSMLDSGIKDGTVNDKYALDYLLLEYL